MSDIATFLSNPFVLLIVGYLAAKGDKVFGSLGTYAVTIGQINERITTIFNRLEKIEKESETRSDKLDEISDTVTQMATMMGLARKDALHRRGALHA